MNDIAGESSNEMVLELDGEYLNADGTLNNSALATIISNTLDGESIMSAEGDHVLSTDGAYLTLELTGYGFVDNEERTLSEVGKILGISKQGCAWLEAEAMKKLRKAMSVKIST